MELKFVYERHIQALKHVLKVFIKRFVSNFYLFYKQKERLHITVIYAFLLFTGFVSFISGYRHNRNLY